MKKAILAVEPELLAEAWGVLQDAGVHLLETVSPTPLLGPLPGVRLYFLIASDLLPDDCANALYRVSAIVYTETYGRQSITRLKHFTLTSRVDPALLLRP